VSPYLEHLVGEYRVILGSRTFNSLFPLLFIQTILYYIDKLINILKSYMHLFNVYLANPDFIHNKSKLQQFTTIKSRILVK